MWYSVISLRNQKGTKKRKHEFESKICLIFYQNSKNTSHLQEQKERELGKQNDSQLQITLLQSKIEFLENENKKISQVCFSYSEKSDRIRKSKKLSPKIIIFTQKDFKNFLKFFSLVFCAQNFDMERKNLQKHIEELKKKSTKNPKVQIF